MTPFARVPLHSRGRRAALGLVGPALASFVLTAGCASSGTPTPPPVPVFFAADEVPCAYEVMGPIREEVLPQGDYDRQKREVLGRAGARRGADAVLSEPSGALTVRRIDFNERRSREEARIPFAGDLIVYTDAACRAAQLDGGGAPSGT